MSEAHQVIGNVGQIDGTVEVTRDGKTVALKAGDAVRVGDVVTAGQNGHAVINVMDAYGEPVGHLNLSPNGSVMADVAQGGAQEGYVFKALTPDGVALTDVDPEFAHLVQLQGGEGGTMFGLFGPAGLLADGSLAAVGGGAVGVGFLASAGGTGSGGSASGSASVSTPDNGAPVNGSTGTTNTPLDAVIDPALTTLNTTPLNAVSVPLGDALSAGSEQLISSLSAAGVPVDMITGSAPGLPDGSGGAPAGGSTTGTPLDAVLDPAFSALNASPLNPVSQPVSDALSSGSETLLTSLAGAGVPVDMLSGGAPGLPGGDGATGGTTTGTPLDAILDPALATLNSSPLAPVSQPLTDALMSGSQMLADGLSGGFPPSLPDGSGGSTGGITGTPLDAVLDPALGTLNSSPLAPVSQPVTDTLSTVSHTLTDALAGGLPSGGLPSGGMPAGGSTTGTPLDTVLDPVLSTANNSPLATVSQPATDAIHTLSSTLTSASPASTGGGTDSMIHLVTDSLSSIGSLPQSGPTDSSATSLTQHLTNNLPL